MLCFVRHPRSFVIRRSSFVRSRVCKNLGRMTQRPCRAKNVINDIPYEYFAQAVLVAKLRNQNRCALNIRNVLREKAKARRTYLSIFTPHNIRGGMICIQVSLVGSGFTQGKCHVFFCRSRFRFCLKSITALLRVPNNTTLANRI